MARGGARPGAGRRTISQEIDSAGLARSALIKKFGSMEKALEDLIKENNPILKKFVYEHAMGKSPDTINIQGDLKHELIVNHHRNRS